MRAWTKKCERDEVRTWTNKYEKNYMRAWTDKYERNEMRAWTDKHKKNDYTRLNMEKLNWRYVQSDFIKCLDLKIE